MNDITRLVQLETLRKDFVANVSHELKTPITSIKGFVETLLDAPDADWEERSRHLGIILNHTNRLNAIIEDLLSLSRLEQADQRITFREFALDDLIASVVDICRRRAEEKAIRVETSIEGSNAGWGNPNLLEQALVNLLDNALKYSAEGGVVKIRTTHDGDSLHFEVEDTGQGIPARDLPRIFERFYRTDRARSRELGGTGLGLAIVKHISRAHRGTVGVESVYGEGSRFSLDIPQDADPDAG
jgi:two-component system phosphate regulon sensor histidine kinase PhoR